MQSLTDFLEGKKALNEVLIRDKRHDILTAFQKAGVHNSAKYLDTENMRRLVRSERIPWIIWCLDSSPMSLASDTELLMKLTDTVLWWCVRTGPISAR